MLSCLATSGGSLIPGLIDEWVPLRVFGQEHDQARLGKRTLLGKSQTALRETGGCLWDY